jgi:Amiloride-sensitive sodium channel
MFRSFKNYCDETTLHGFKYFTKVRINRSEKLFWCVSLIFSFASCVVLISKLVAEIRRTPIVTVTSNTPVPIGDIPFPAVAFCQEVRIQESDEVYSLLQNFYYDEHDHQSFVELTTNDNSSSWKYLQGFDLIMDDESTLQFNVTFEQHELIPFMNRNFYDKWREAGRSYQHEGGFRKKYHLKLATLLTRFGFCPSWNLIEPDELMNLDM